MFRIQIDFPTDEIRRQIQAAGASLDGSRRDLAEQIAPAFRSLLIEDFDAKSAGQPGADGTVWLPDSPATLRAKGTDRVGVRHGDLQDSLEVRPGDGFDSDLTAEYTAPHAEHFDVIRELLPDGEALPAPWESELDAMVLEWAERRVQGVLD